MLTDSNAKRVSRYRLANDELRRAFRRWSNDRSYSEVYAFMCECPQSECVQMVQMTLHTFDELRNTGAAVCADGHHLVSPAQPLPVR